jgi:hypothetical protein
MPMFMFIYFPAKMKIEEFSRIRIAFNTKDGKR